MHVELTVNEADRLIAVLESAKSAIRERQGTPNEVRQQNLREMESLQEKLRAAKASG